jgi:hypothetical protein
MNNIDYAKIYNYLKQSNKKVVSACSLAHAVGIARIYGGTMAKLVRDGYLSKCALDGYYYNTFFKK